MMGGTLIQFDGKQIVTVHRSGIIDIRLVNDAEHITLSGRMHINEFAEVVDAVFTYMVDDAMVVDKDKLVAERILADIKTLKQVWR